MAAFATTEAAETRAKAKMADNTWIVAHAQRTGAGAIAVRVQQKMSAAAPTVGAWTDLTDDAAV